MALIHGSFYSDSLKFQAHFNAIVPFDSDSYCKETQRTMILLHGMLDGCDTWLTQTPIYSYAMTHNLFVFMPEGQRSFYVDMDSGGNYQSYLSRELPECFRQMFGISWNRSTSFIAGNSMGGYGALYTALANPGLFAGCAAFSPVVSPQESLMLIPSSYQIPGEIQAVFGNSGILPDKYNLYRLASTYQQHLDLYLTCGYEDFLSGQSTAFHKHLDTIGFPHEFSQWSGDHGWNYWRKAIDHYMKKLGTV